MVKTQLAPIIIGKLLNLGGMLHKHGNSILLPFNLNQHQFSIFFEIAKAGKVNQKEIVNRLELEKAHISKTVKKLHNMQLIKIEPSKEDNRSAWLLPTKKGNETLGTCMEIFEQWNKEWTDTVEKNQLHTILESLTTLQTIFKKKI